MSTVLWFRRDLRLRDHPALVAAVESSHRHGDGRTVALFVLDPSLWAGAGPVRRAYLCAALGELAAAMDGALLVRQGDPAQVVPAVAAAAGAAEVHVSADFSPYGVRRDEGVAAALRRGGVAAVATGSPYAVSPGRVRKDDGTAYRVYTPFYRAWRRHGWRPPATGPGAAPHWWLPMPSEPLPPAPVPPGVTLPPAGEAAAWARWGHVRDRVLASYDTDRDRPGIDGTSRLSHHLKWGELHPRSLLATLGDAPGDETFRKELAWREFYADVLAQRPDSAWSSLDARFDTLLDWDEGPTAEDRLERWRQGQTGYPFVDAGMRQLATEGWMHNRARMVAASFLVKDLHLPWQVGARWFLERLVDADLASNQHGWQWTAGCGTDAAPYHRVFNPVLQGRRFDPDGAYVRRYIPQLRHVEGPAVHEPWTVPDGHALGYPPPVVAHHEERDEALRRFALACIEPPGATPRDGAAGPERPPRVRKVRNR